ncbi:mitochondrial import inner membrane translocase subunit tim54 [Geranomyces variabilis]|nr:mitochondrial import inner membrane translocase subunit tim54 [Geranomyces variabilis]
MTVMASIRSRLPSRNWSIFLGTTSFLTVVGCYDKYELRKVRQELDDRAAVIRNEVMQPKDIPRKIRVFVAPTHWGRYWFKEYIKPVFDSAALDYEICEPKVSGQVRDSVRELLWTGKDEQRAWDQQRYRYDPHAPPVFILDRPKFDSGEGLVAVGPNAWREVLRGLRDGCLAERPLPPPPPPATLELDAAMDGGDKTSDEKKEKEKVVEPPAAPLEYSVTNLPSFPIPPVGFISGRNQSGWTGFPRRIFGWFNERHTAREIGEEALRVAFGRVRPFERDADPALGAAHIYVHDDWEDVHKEIVKEVEVEPWLAEKLWVYE